MSSIANVELLQRRPSLWRRAAPAITLAVLAPVIGELLLGSTRLSFLFVLIPEIMVWGCGALMAREAVRRWKGGATSLVFLGLALCVAEEWVIQQTSLAPMPWTRVQYGRLWGVNWLWFLIMLGYECVWVVLIPVQVTELIFRKRRNQPWLSNGGFAAAGGIFLFGAFVAGFLWLHVALPRRFHLPAYNPPAWQLILGVLTIAALVLAAYWLRLVDGAGKAMRWTPPVWTAFVAALLLAVPWFGLMSFIFGGRQSWPFEVPMALGCAWGVMAWAVVRYWTAPRDWSDMHRWALVFGATVASMTCGFAGSSRWPEMDLIFKALLNAMAVVGFVLLGLRLRPSEVPALAATKAR